MINKLDSRSFKVALDWPSLLRTSKAQQIEKEPGARTHLLQKKNAIYLMNYEKCRGQFKLKQETAYASQQTTIVRTLLQDRMK